MSTTLLTNTLAAVQADSSLPWQSVTLTAQGGSPTVEVQALVTIDSQPDDETGKKEIARVNLSGISNADVQAAFSRRLRVYDRATISGTEYVITSVRTGHVASGATAELGTNFERTGRNIRL